MRIGRGGGLGDEDDDEKEGYNTKRNAKGRWKKGIGRASGGISAVALESSTPRGANKRVKGLSHLDTGDYTP
ncbi:hypothetical protein M0804_012320 [Polistes exclamans]|nr:hypothetical protein M0804_012320 [Polistes exclamans]